MTRAGSLLGSVAFLVLAPGTVAGLVPWLTGLYRHVRNPMYAAVVSVVLGQGLLFGSVRKRPSTDVLTAFTV